MKSKLKVYFLTIKLVPEGEVLGITWGEELTHSQWKFIMTRTCTLDLVISIRRSSHWSSSTSVYCDHNLSNQSELPYSGDRRIHSISYWVRSVIILLPVGKRGLKRCKLYWITDGYNLTTLNQVSLFWTWQYLAASYKRCLYILVYIRWLDYKDQI